MTETEIQRAKALCDDGRVGWYQWGKGPDIMRVSWLEGAGWVRGPEHGYGWWHGVGEQAVHDHLSEHFRAWLAERGWCVALFWSTANGRWCWEIRNERGERKSSFRPEDHFVALLTAMELCLKDGREELQELQGKYDC